MVHLTANSGLKARLPRCCTERKTSVKIRHFFRCARHLRECFPWNLCAPANKRSIRTHKGRLMDVFVKPHKRLKRVSTPVIRQANNLLSAGTFHSPASFVEWTGRGGGDTHRPGSGHFKFSTGHRTDDKHNDDGIFSDSRDNTAPRCGATLPVGGEMWTHYGAIRPLMMMIRGLCGY